MNPNLHVVERFYEHIWNRHDTSQIPELIHDGFTFRGSLGQEKCGHDEFAGYVDFVHEALGKYRCTIEEAIGEGDRLFARMVFSGVHQGEFFGYAPTGMELSWAGAAVFTFSDGKICDLWVLGDVYGLIEQLTQNVQASMAPA